MENKPRVIKILGKRIRIVNEERFEIAEFVVQTALGLIGFAAFYFLAVVLYAAFPGLW